MKVYGASHGVIRVAAREAELRVRMFGGVGPDGDLSVKLLTRSDGPYAITSAPYPLPPHAVCIHGYEAFIEALLELQPNAVIETTQATYRGLDDFDQRQDELMAQLETAYGDQVCECES